MLRFTWCLPLAAALLATSLARPAAAHLVAPEHATVRVASVDVFSVVSIPSSALAAFDDDRDGLTSQAELARHVVELKADVGARWVLSSGGEAARTVSLDLFLQPPDGAEADRADQVVMLHHARFSRVPGAVDVHADLFGATAALAVHATRDGHAEDVTLDRAHRDHAFFAPPPAKPRRDAWWIAAAFAVAAAVRLGTARFRSRPRPPR